MQSWIGTSGFQYPEWKGKFYPQNMSAAKMLAFYAAEFGSTEVNYTFRSLPSAKTIERWKSGTPDAFRFSLKAPQRVTHFAKLRDCRAVLDTFFTAVKGLGEKLGPVLFQLPPTFKADVSVLRDFLGTLPKGMRAAIEFRHESWFTDEVFDILSQRNAALCIAESEELRAPTRVTADFGYLRLRREDYKPSEIKAWAKFVSGQAKTWLDAFVYFKHEETCVGPEFAKAFTKALGR
jgi:uncharacterized protein YecE (DUF72 family)